MSGRAIRIAEAAAQAWWQAKAGNNDAVPLGVVAALALLGQRDPAGPGPAEQIQAASDEEIADLLSETWCYFTIGRPELACRCGPFAAWLDEDPRGARLTAGAAAVARAAVKAGLLDVTLDRGTAQDADLLGFVYQVLRGDRAKKAFGEMYTPASVAEALAQLTLQGSQPGQSICEPTAGTGGMIRAAAAVLRQEGKDPHEYWWFACDIDPVVVAGLAVNMHVWDIGPRVVVGCADILAEGDWEQRALAEQRHAIAMQRDRVKAARLLAAVRALELAPSGLGSSPPPGPPAGAATGMPAG